jgi:hypothetical protein
MPLILCFEVELYKNVSKRTIKYFMNQLPYFKDWEAYACFFYVIAKINLVSALFCD